MNILITVLAYGPYILGYADERVDQAAREGMEIGGVFALATELEYEAHFFNSCLQPNWLDIQILEQKLLWQLFAWVERSAKRDGYYG